MLRFLGVIFLLVLIVGGAGLYLGWFRLSSETGENSSVKVDLNKDKIGKDLGKARDKIGDVMKGESISGTIEKLDLPERTFDLKTDAGTVPIAVTDDLPVTLGGADANIMDLKIGDEVSVSFQDVDGKKTATRIEAQRN